MRSRFAIVYSGVMMLCVVLWSTLSSMSQEIFLESHSLSSAIITPYKQRPLAFDHDGKIMRYSWELEEQFRILRSYPNLYEARLHQRDDSTIWLEVLQVHRHGAERMNYQLSEHEYMRIRTEVSEALHHAGMVWQEERTAHWEDWLLGGVSGMYGLSMGILSAGFAALSTPLSQSPPTDYWWIPAVVLTSAHAWAAHQNWYNRSAATLWSSGLLQGTLHGWAAYFLAAPQPFNAVDFIHTGIAGACIEAGAGLAFSQLFALNTAQAQTISSAAESGFALAVYSNILGNTAARSGSVDGIRILGASLLAGSATGVWLGQMLGQAPDLTGGDSYVLTTPARMLTVAPFPILTGFQQNTSAPVAAGIALGGIVSSYILGSELIRNKDFSFLQGRVINYSALLGTALPLYIFSGSINNAVLNNQSQQAEALQLAASLTSFLGGIAGYAIPYLLYARHAEEQNSRRLSAIQAYKHSINTTSEQPLLEECSASHDNCMLWLERIVRHSDICFSPLGFIAFLAPNVFPWVQTPILSIHTALGSLFTEE
ncbi:MAG: hypothetical protein RML40_03480 [Bacteroidota bacterium]|nr:hypothetical protein [Candidatus Kapabacteria bacterium]MDW8219572.1 hypothetical protein [Bacteroidota bacterium]